MKILVAGIGNIFHGDDAFGVEVAQLLLQRTLPPDVRVTDFGIRGIDLAYALLDGADVTILVDATPQGGPPGSLYTIEIDPNSASDGHGADLSPHGMTPLRVLQMAQALGGCKGRVLLVGCEPESLGPEEGRMGLSDTVAAAVEPAVRVVEDLILTLGAS